VDAIALHGVTKWFGSTLALDRLDLTVAAGEVHGFLGPNGAGKTTTLRALVGLLRVDGGDITVLDRDPWRDAVDLHARIAYVPGDVALWPSLSGGQVIDLLGRLHGGVDPQRRDELIAAFDLDPSRRCRTYSKGNRQKVALIAALAMRAELTILDEPTSGLDPLMEETFRRCVADLRAEGRTVLLSSHLLSEVEQLADRVTIIRGGRAVETGSLVDLRHLMRTVVSADLDRVPEGLGALAGVHDLIVSGGHVELRVDAEAVNDVLTVLTTAGIRSLASRPPSLEDVFRQHYGSAP
jgi:ABC-2 type transport system ATP-binding protein